MVRGFINNPRGVLREKFDAVRSLALLVTDPEPFLDRKVNSANIRWEVVLILLVGTMSAVGVYYVSLLVGDIIQADDMRFAIAGKMMRPFLIIFLLWFGYSLVFHFVANRVRGRGPPGPVFKGIAWALLPIGVGNLVQSVAMVFVYSGMDINAAMSGTGPRENLTVVLDAGLREPVMIVAMVVFLLTLVWSGYLMTFVVQHAKDLEHSTAVKVVAVPVAIQILFLVLGLIQGTVNFAMVL